MTLLKVTRWRFPTSMSKLIGLLGLIISFSLFAEPPSQSLYLDGDNSKWAVILLHGRGHHPDWLVVGPLRKSIHTRLGFHTLSLQLPNDLDHWTEYADVFPAVYQQINQAVAYLLKHKQVQHIYLLGHSMGARMSSAYLANQPDHPIKGLIIVGCRNNGGHPLSCSDSLMDVDIPVLDIWGDESDKDVYAGEERKALQRQGYTQISVQGADHRFDGEEGLLAGSIINWLKQQQAVED